MKEGTKKASELPPLKPLESIDRLLSQARGGRSGVTGGKAITDRNVMRKRIIAGGAEPRNRKRFETIRNEVG